VTAIYSFPVFHATNGDAFIIILDSEFNLDAINEEDDAPSDTPSIHPALAAVQRLHHHAHVHHPHTLDLASIPWAEMFTNKTSLTILLNAFVNGWIGFIAVTQLPSYIFYELSE
jgi:hypothetical protein